MKMQNNNYTIKIQSFITNLNLKKLITASSYVSNLTLRIDL